ncbi:MAG: hypothetical protein M3Q07_00100, partial [Pseudobdellovibrionaceae bacterium]|nr:hypothetical protein [Pseudobdellovibrionaceae bacterium]
MARNRPAKTGSRKQKISTEYLLLGVLMIGIAFVILRGKNTTISMQAETPPAVEGQVNPVQVLPSHQSPVDVRKYQDELNQQRAQFAQARSLGLKSMPLKNQGDTVTIPLVFAPNKVWCQGGDLDTMRYGAKSDTNKEFLITLEAIGRGGKNPFVRTSLKELQKGVSYSFTIPKPKDTTAYGVYICTDGRKENSCQRKGIETHSQASTELAEDPNKARSEDRVFFFQNLVIDSKKVEAYRTDDFS